MELGTEVSTRSSEANDAFQPVNKEGGDARDTDNVVISLRLSDGNELNYRNGIVSWFLDTMKSSPRIVEFVLRVCDTRENIHVVTTVFNQYIKVLQRDVRMNTNKQYYRLDFYTSFCNFYRGDQMVVKYDDVSYDDIPRLSKVNDCVVRTPQNRDASDTIDIRAIDNGELKIWANVTAAYATSTLDEVTFDGYFTNPLVAECRSYTVRSINNKFYDGLASLPRDGNYRAVIDGESYLIIIPHAISLIVDKVEPSTLFFFAVKTTGMKDLELCDIDMTYILHPLAVTLLSQMSTREGVTYDGLLGRETPIGLVECYEKLVNDPIALNKMIAQSEQKQRLDVFYIVLIASIFSSCTSEYGTPVGMTSLPVMLATITRSKDPAGTIRREVTKLMDNKNSPRLALQYSLGVIIARCKLLKNTEDR
jgi:hypothetical protein